MKRLRTVSFVLFGLVFSILGHAEEVAKGDKCECACEQQATKPTENKTTAAAQGTPSISVRKESVRNL